MKVPGGGCTTKLPDDARLSRALRIGMISPAGMSSSAAKRLACVSTAPERAAREARNWQTRRRSWETLNMSTSMASPDLVNWVQRLTPAQVRHLTLVVNNDGKLPHLPTDSESAVLAAKDSDEEDEVPAGILALIGSLDDAPADLRTNSQKYLAERNARHGLPPRA